MFFIQVIQPELKKHITGCFIKNNQNCYIHNLITIANFGFSVFFAFFLRFFND